MLSHEQIKQRLQDRHVQAVADAIGVSFGTVQRIKKGNGNPTLIVLTALSNYFEEQEAK